MEMSKKPIHYDSPWIIAMKKKAAAKKGALQPQKSILKKVGSSFTLSVGLSVFGSPSYFNVDSAIFEFKSFVESNSRLRLDIVLNKYKALGLDEYHKIPGRGGCSFVNPKYLRKQTLDKLPLDVAVQIMIYDIQSTKTCYGGLAYRQSRYTRNAPFTAIAFGDSIKWWSVEPGWKSKVATTLVHEFYHTLTYLFSTKRIKLPNPDKAVKYGFTPRNDPGWVRFDKYIYGQITEEKCLTLTK
jgi:hypothetical protein